MISINKFAVFEMHIFILLPNIFNTFMKIFQFFRVVKIRIFRIKIQVVEYTKPFYGNCDNRYRKIVASYC